MLQLQQFNDWLQPLEATARGASTPEIDHSSIAAADKKKQFWQCDLEELRMLYRKKWITATAYVYGIVKPFGNSNSLNQNFGFDPKPKQLELQLILGVRIPSGLQLNQIPEDITLTAVPTILAGKGGAR